MEIKLKNTAEQIELIKAMGSNNSTVAREATEAVATFLGPVVRQILETAGTVAKIYRDVEFDEDSDLSIPLDLFYAEGTGYVTVWAQNMAGGLPTSQVEGVKELKFGTYRLDSGVSFNKKYARKSRLDVISKSIEKLVQEVLVKQERNGWAVILKALAEAQTRTINGGTLIHVIAGGAAGQFALNDLNNLMVRIKRINESFSGNTPVAPYSNGVTDLYISPETMGKVRAFAYNAVSTTATASTGSDAVRNQYLTDDVRNDIYRNAGMKSIYGINLNELIEFGAGQKYNTLFNSFTGAQTLPAPGGNWASTNEIIVGIDNTRGVFLRPVARQAESGGTFSVIPDGQFDMYGTRVQKVGFYGFLEEGRICLDARAIAGIVI